MGFLKQHKNRQSGTYLCGFSGLLISSTTSLKVQKSYILYQVTSLTWQKEIYSFGYPSLLLKQSMVLLTHLIACTRYAVAYVGRGLNATGRTDVDIFNVPELALFWDTLDSCMKQLKASGNFETKNESLKIVDSASLPVVIID